MKVYGSPLCPDCVNADAILEAHGIHREDYEYVDVTAAITNLREFIYFREANPAAFDPIRPNRAVGIPCFILDDGTITFDVNDVIK